MPNRANTKPRCAPAQRSGVLLLSTPEPPHAGHDLIATAKAYFQLDAEYGVLCRLADVRPPRRRPQALDSRLAVITSRMSELHEALVQMHPRTAEDWRALALVALCEMGGGFAAPGPIEEEHALAWAVLSHVAGRD